MALSWLNLPCALKAAIGIGKQTLGHPASLPRHRGRSKGLLRVREVANTRATSAGGSPFAPAFFIGGPFFSGLCCYANLAQQILNVSAAQLAALMEPPGYVAYVIPTFVDDPRSERARLAQD